MVETNARILRPGKDIALPIRYALVRGTTNTPELREKICYRLRREHGVVAVPCQDSRERLIVVTDAPLPPREFRIDEWKLTVSDAGEAKVLTLTSTEGWQLLPGLAERLMTDAIARRGTWWTYDSPRHWYERQPFDAAEGIDALRRYAVSAFPIEGVGIGIAVDVETAFFTQNTVAYFLDPRVGPLEQERRRSLFDRLTLRQRGQKGTLLYNNGINSRKCYFEKCTTGKVCGSTLPRKVRGQEYKSLAQYYQAINEELEIQPSDIAAMVSFPGLDYPQPVAARLLKVRVMNEILPSSLINVDKIAPNTRKQMVEAFWEEMGDTLFPQFWGAEYIHPALLTGGGLSMRMVSRYMKEGSSPSKEMELPSLPDGSLLRPKLKGDANCSFADAFQPGFWRPEAGRLRQIAFPTLHFADGATLQPPAPHQEAYRRHFLRRGEMMDAQGGYHFWPLMGRSLVCAYPEEPGLCEAVRVMMDDICQWMICWTGKPFEWRPLPYASISAAIAETSGDKSAGTVVFVMNEEPAVYAEVALGLPNWKVKRIRQKTLSNQHRNRILGTKSSQGRAPDMEKGKRFWDSFVKMTSLDLFQTMEGVPFRIGKAGEFDAQLVIDVAYDRRSYALSFLVARESEKRPDFLLQSIPIQKPDTKHEAINGVHLRDDIVKYVPFWMGKKSVPLASLLVARDGKLCQKEHEAILAAVETLKRLGSLAPDARVVIVELHKNTEMHLRLWKVGAGEVVTNALEGTAIHLSANAEVLATTGAGTLSQGTADPMLVVCPDKNAVIGQVTDSLAASAHLNWSSPTVAQRLPTPFKRTDEVLQDWAAREIRRLA